MEIPDSFCYKLWKKSIKIVILGLIFHVMTVQGSVSDDRRDLLFNKFDKWAEKIRTNYDTTEIIDFATNNNEQFKNDLPVLVEIVYAYNVKNTENILNFLQRLPNIDQRIVGHKALFEIMKTSRHQNSHYLLLLDHTIKKTMEMSNFTYVDQHYKNIIKTIDNDLKIYVNNFIESWATKIRQGYIADIINIVSPSCGVIIGNYWSQIMKKSYLSNLWNVDNILEFIYKLPCISQQAKCLVGLFTEMKNNNHLNSYQLMTVAYRIKQKLDFINMNVNENYSPEGYHYYKDMMTSLKNNLPNSVMSFIWSERTRCTIKNINYGEYMYGGDYWQSYCVYTWKSETDAGEPSFWQIDALENGQHFTIKNTYFSGFLCSGNEFDEKNLYSDVNCATKMFYYFTPEDGKFLISRSAYGYHLYAHHTPKGSRRYVLNWTPEELTDSVKRNALWEVKC